METSFYDVVVCGHELGAVLAAALLGRRGFRVLLLGHDAHPLSFDVGGFTLARGAGGIPALDSPALARVLHDLSLVQVLRRRVAPAGREAEVWLDHRRFVLRADDDRLHQEIDAWWPAEASDVRAAVTRLSAIAARITQAIGTGIALPPQGFWERREWSRTEALLPRAGADVFAPLSPEHAFRRIAAQPALADAALASSDLAALGPATLASAFQESRSGLGFVQGGEAGLWKLLLDKLETFSGERHPHGTPTEVIWRGGRATGVRVRPRDETLGCTALVWAGSSRSLLSLLGDRVPRKAREAPERVRPAFCRYALSMWLRAGQLTEGAPTRRFLLAPASRAAVEEAAITFTTGAPDPRHGGAAPAWAECLLPAGAVRSGPAAAGYFGALRARLRARLAAALPSFDRDVLCLGSVYDGLPPEEPSGAERPGGDEAPSAMRVAGPALPAQPMPIVYASDQPPRFDALGTPHGIPGLRNVFLLGRENLPGLGVSGELAAAWNVTRLLASSLRAPRLARQSMLVRAP